MTIHRLAQQFAMVAFRLDSCTALHVLIRISSMRRLMWFSAASGRAVGPSIGAFPLAFAFAFTLTRHINLPCSSQIIDAMAIH